MQEIVFIVHILTAICLVCLVLMQHGKGADAGAGFAGGGSSNTVFGGIGSLPFLIKVTALTAAIFFVTSITLQVMIANHAKKDTIQMSV